MRILLALLAISGCAGSTPGYLVLATTTSVGNSGLLDVLVPAWQQAGGSAVRPTLAGSGRALRMLELRQADLVISHSPEAETVYVARHPDWLYRKIMFNEFVIVGPPADAAHVRTASTLEEAVRRIARSKSRFLSRADQSGTHEREQFLWKLAGAIPAPDRLMPSGAGMAVTLRQASELDAYTLTDRATFEQVKGAINLSILWGGDPHLLNAYAVIVDPEGPRATEALRFARWLEEGDGRRRIDSYRIAGSTVPPFTVWPASARRDMPAASPR
jgi:tungstate transport system substrate-binding protein